LALVSYALYWTTLVDPCNWNYIEFGKSSDV